MNQPVLDKKEVTAALPGNLEGSCLCQACMQRLAALR
jgi:hypothetical protein